MPGEIPKSQEKYRNILTNIEEGYYEVDLAGNIGLFNDSMCHILGYSRKELAGMNNRHFMDEENAKKVYRTFNEVYRTGKPQKAFDWEVIRKDGTKRFVEASVTLVIGSKGQPAGFMGIARDITQRKEAEQELQRRNQELALLVESSQILNSSLELDHVLIKILEEVRRLMQVVGSSIWLVDPATADVVCRQAAGIHQGIVRGWRLNQEKSGIASWVSTHGESVIVPDTRKDPRHFKGVDKQMGVEIRSVLSAPLLAQGRVIGALQVVDTEVGRFSHRDMTLLEALAASAGIGIENARLYEQSRHEIEERKRAEEALEAKTIRLEEVNTALRVLLEKRDEDKNELIETIMMNIKELVEPYLEKIKGSGLDKKQQAYAEILASNLNDIISPFTQQLSSKFLNLTPTEIQIANLIKQGKTTKEVAEVLNLSNRTVDTHRLRIRTKLNIRNKKINLRSHLLSFL